jgi:hypothetical protein
MATESPCQLLNLPAELRFRIYEYALAPTGTLCLTSSSSMRYCTVPTIASALLTTCRQIHTEAVDILYHNSVCVYVDAHDTYLPILSENRLPQGVLRKLQRLCVILDCTGQLHGSFSDVNWSPFSALISLQDLRITIIKQDGHNALTAMPELFQEVLTHILERIPAAAAVVYGTDPGTGEREHAVKVAQRRQQQSFRNELVEEVDKEGLRNIAKAMVDLQQGCKSSGVGLAFTDSTEALGD